MDDCGCGRSPNGKCIGWHGLSEEEYQEKLKKYEEPPNSPLMPLAIVLVAIELLINIKRSDTFLLSPHTAAALQLPGHQMGSM